MLFFGCGGVVMSVWENEAGLESVFLVGGGMGRLAKASRRRSAKLKYVRL